MAEIELSALCGQCLNRRIGDLKTMRREIAAWQQDRNNRQAKIDWHFTTHDARTKLKPPLVTLEQNQRVEHLLTAMPTTGCDLFIRIFKCYTVLVARNQLPSGPRLLGVSPSRLVFQERSVPQIFQANLVGWLSYSATCFSHIHSILKKLQQL